MALELEVVGLMNAQLAYQDGEVYIIEVNRAARALCRLLASVSVCP